jgi:hypothetical protein
MTKERLVDFFEEFIFPHYKDHLIILDNAGSHNNQYVKDAILESGNKYQFSVPYTPKTNCIELFFNQIKHYLKLNRRVLKFKELEKEVSACPMGTARLLLPLGVIEKCNYKASSL